MTGVRRARVRVRGHVQGVYFRADARARARGLGLAGWVRNAADGSVEAVFERRPTPTRREHDRLVSPRPLGSPRRRGRGRVGRAARGAGLLRSLGARYGGDGHVTVTGQSESRSVQSSSWLVRPRSAYASRRFALSPRRRCAVPRTGSSSSSSASSEPPATPSTWGSTPLLVLRGLHYLAAAVCSFVVAVTNNYTWNRLWTFRAERGHVALQGALPRRLAGRAGREPRSAGGARRLRRAQGPAQAVAIVLVTPLSFLGNKLWSFR